MSIAAITDTSTWRWFCLSSHVGLRTERLRLSGGLTR